MTIRCFTSSLCFERHGVHLVRAAGGGAGSVIEEAYRPDFATPIHLVTRSVPAARAAGTAPLVFPARENVRVFRKPRIAK
jgi:hypothetical protein